ncbi:hypothetical protein VTN00DRAFT_7642 [Thermoascus crustaceus]|uniref:uncharacterized protein n=1 Tax=Thermoascus crustaceus TaxID=5088 RepID=UPI0037423A3C
MIASSPTSAALQSGTHCSPSSRSHHEPALSNFTSSFHPSQSSSAAAGAVPPRGAAPPSAPSRSRLAQGIEEIRSALKRHTVDSRPSGDHPRGHMSAGLNTLGGGTRIADAAESTTSNSTVTAPAAAPLAPPMPAAGAGAKRNTPGAPQNAVSNDNNGSVQQQQPDAEAEGSSSKRPRPAKPPVKLLPQRYELANPRDLVVLISSMLMELIRFNDKIPLHEGRLTRFHSRSPPRISVHDYLQRLTTHATLSPPILLSMVYYIDRLCALYPAFTVSSLTVHRFLIASATVASKGLSDSFWTNKTYARVGGISVAELALLELEFLWRVEWRIVPQPEVLVDYYRSLVERCEGYQIEPDEGSAGHRNGNEDPSISTGQ